MDNDRYHFSKDECIHLYHSCCAIIDLWSNISIFFFFSLFLSLYFSREKLEKKQSTGDDKQKHSRIFFYVNRSSPWTIKEELMSSEIITFICAHTIPMQYYLQPVWKANFKHFHYGSDSGIYISGKYLCYFGESSLTECSISRCSCNTHKRLIVSYWWIFLFTSLAPYY